MSRFSAPNVPFAGTKTGTGHRARIRERDNVPVPFPVPFCPANVPIGESAALHVASQVSEHSEKPIPSNRAWLHMLAEGGRWTARELADATGCSRQILGITLAIWARRGVAVRHVVGANRAAYSVALKSKLPDGLLLVELQSALRAAGALEAL